MFHILAGTAEILKAWPEREATHVLCKVDTPRCAISQKRFDVLVNQKKLNDDRLCKVCYKHVGGNPIFNGRRKEE